MSDSRGGCQLAAVPWSAAGVSRVRASPVCDSVLPRLFRVPPRRRSANTRQTPDPRVIGLVQSVPVMTCVNASSREQPGGFSLPAAFRRPSTACTCLRIRRYEYRAFARITRPAVRPAPLTCWQHDDVSLTKHKICAVGRFKLESELSLQHQQQIDFVGGEPALVNWLVLLAHPDELDT